MNEEELILNNKKLVYFCAKDFRHRPDYDDIVSEGMLALCLAAKRYDESKHTKFSTFACSYIKGTIFRFIATNKVIAPIARNQKQLKSYFEQAEIIYIDDNEAMQIPAEEIDDNKLSLDLLVAHTEDELTKRIIELKRKGYNHAEISRQIHYSKVTVGTKVNQFIEDSKKNFEKLL